ncbi:MAG TPA: transposase [Polyangiaceae bacterium]
MRIYDGTGQRVPPRGRAALPACTKGKAGTKWVMGYSIKTGLLEHGLCGAETAAEIPLWRQLVPSFTRNVLYLLDLGFFERALFASAEAAGAHVLMRLKSTAKVRVSAHERVRFSL